MASKPSISFTRHAVPKKGSVVVFSVEQGELSDVARSVDPAGALGRAFPIADFTGKFASSVSCVICHADYGRQALWEFDEWGTMVKAANLTVPAYRGGRRPVDLYYRIHSGINGSGMVGFANSVSGEQIWDLVNFVQTLPYPAMRSKYGVHID